LRGVKQNFRRYFKKYKEDCDKKKNKEIEEEEENEKKRLEKEKEEEKEEEGKGKEKEKEEGQTNLENLEKVEDQEKNNLSSKNDGPNNDDPNNDQSKLKSIYKKTTTENNDNMEDQEFQDNYCSSSLMNIVQEKFNKCQEFVENYVIKNEEFWSKNRKKFYCIIPINIDPPVINEENMDMDDAM